MTCEYFAGCTHNFFSCRASMDGEWKFQKKKPANMKKKWTSTHCDAHLVVGARGQETALWVEVKGVDTAVVSLEFVTNLQALGQLQRTYPAVGEPRPAAFSLTTKLPERRWVTIGQSVPITLGFGRGEFSECIGFFLIIIDISSC